MEHIIEPLLIAILTPILIGLLRFILPIKDNFKLTPIDAIEGKKLENKRNLGCFFYFIIIAIILSFSASFTWQSLYSWVHHYPEALYIEYLDRINIYVISVYLAAPISVIVTNYWFTLQYGEEKFNLLQNHFTFQYKFNNPKAEKLLFYVFLIPAVFIIWIMYFPITYVTKDELCKRREFSTIFERYKISDVETIDYIKNILHEGESCSGWPGYRLILKDGTKLFSQDINDNNSADYNRNIHQMYQYISEKSRKKIHTIDCISWSEY